LSCGTIGCWRKMPRTPEILDALKGSATLVLVVSPGCLKSPWYQREKHAFYELVRSKNRTSHSVFVVHRDRVELEPAPKRSAICLASVSGRSAVITWGLVWRKGDRSQGESRKEVVRWRSKP
jgi:hypothetical protein